MPEPLEGIYWSPRAERFYAEGRRGSVSRESALPSLRYDQDAARFRDTRGRLVPDDQLLPAERRVQRIAGLDAEGNPFVKTVMSDTLIDANRAQNIKLAGNEQTIVRVVVKMDDGRLIIGEASSKLRGRYQLSALEEQAARNARAKAVDRGYAVTTPDVSARTINRSYLLRRVAVE